MHVKFLIPWRNRNGTERLQKWKTLEQIIWSLYYLDRDHLDCCIFIMENWEFLPRLKCQSFHLNSPTGHQNHLHHWKLFISASPSLHLFLPALTAWLRIGKLAMEFTQCLLVFTTNFDAIGHPVFIFLRKSILQGPVVFLSTLGHLDELSTKQSHSYLNSWQSEPFNFAMKNGRSRFLLGCSNFSFWSQDKTFK